MVGSTFTPPQKWDKKIDVGELTKLKIFVNEKDSFEANNLNIFTNYVITFYDANLITKWQTSCDMTFYQNQLNFAVWCASSGCGVSVRDHLFAKENLLAAVFKFHIYYQTRKILEEMSCPIPGESIFNAMDNRIDKIKYQKLCNEFGINGDEDFRFKGGDNNGLGTMYNYATNVGYISLNGVAYDPNKFQFIENSTNGIYKIDYIKQDNAVDGWKQFLLRKLDSDSFTRAGIVRLDDSIREYVYCILGSQAQTRSNILTSLETQQTFVDLLEQNIKSMFSIPESIDRYQSSISKTNVRINYVIGIGLYMIPSDLVLKVGSVQKYNNNILIADKSLKIGYNAALNIEDRHTTIKSEISESKNEMKFTPVAQLPESVSKIPKETHENVNVYVSLCISLLVFGVCCLFLRK